MGRRKSRCFLIVLVQFVASAQEKVIWLRDELPALRVPRVERPGMRCVLRSRRSGLPGDGSAPAKGDDLSDEQKGGKCQGLLSEGEIQEIFILAIFPPQFAENCVQSRQQHRLAYHAHNSTERRCGGI